MSSDKNWEPEELDWQQQVALAKIGHGKHLQRLVEDNRPWVRELAAAYGQPHHRDKLLNDPSPHIQYSIARRGNKEQAMHLAKHGSDDFIRRRARWRLIEIDQHGENY